MKNFVSLFLPRFSETIAYMLQATEYEPKAYLAWLYRTKDFGSVMRRRQLERTKVARLFVGFVRFGMELQFLVAFIFLLDGLIHQNAFSSLMAVVLFASAPVAWAILVLIPLFMARRTIILPKRRRERLATERTFAATKAVKIAVAGSYGKTTMKELLAAVLSEGKRVAATPANKNVATAHYRFAKSLKGDEDVIVVEFGEGRPGDVRSFAETLRPDIGVITGLAPAHLDQYKTLRAAGEDIFSLADFLPADKLYANGESEAAANFLKPEYQLYGRAGLAGWKVSNLKVSIEGTSFTLAKAQTKLSVTSGLLGTHLVGMLSAVAVIALDLGLTKKQVEAGLAKTKPYEHRMQPYQLGGAWVIDDAYNGNIEGIKAGTQLLGALEAKRKIYVSPGLVDQGEESTKVHRRMGELIAAAKPDVVVLMQNSVTSDIQAGLDHGQFKGEVLVQTDPLKFYTSLDQFVAVGDIVMLQNDWTDNYQ
jgi:UDP-N-acetylmuramoyl-tripeptide--D-alanyl-D-alanine ligase